MAPRVNPQIAALRVAGSSPFGRIVVTQVGGSPPPHVDLSVSARRVIRHSRFRAPLARALLRSVHDGGLAMGIEIDPNAVPDVHTELGSAGRVQAYAPVQVSASLPTGRRDNVQQAVAIRWQAAPTTARMSQLVSLMAFLRHDAEHVPLRPAPPHTDILLGSRVRFQLSPPDPSPRVWELDAIPDPGRRDLGRAYVTDESYSFSERDGDEIRFYDAPTLSLSHPDDAVRAMGLSPAHFRSYELLGLFLTELWLGRRLLGMVEW